MLRELRRTWGAAVRARRGRMSQQELAQLIGRKQATVSKIEQGAVNVTDEMKLRIAQALDCRVDDIFGWPDDPANTK